MKTIREQSFAPQPNGPRRHAAHTHRIATAATACVLSVSLALASAAPAFAATTEIDADPDELQVKIEESAAAYEEATGRVEDLQAQIDENNAHIAEIEARLPEYEANAQDALVSMYKMQSQSPTLVSMVLQSQSLDEFITTLTYMNTVHEENLAELQTLADARSEIEAAQAELIADKAEAESEQQRAQSALDEAQAAREEAQRKAEEQAAAEAEEARKAQEEAQKEEAADPSPAPSPAPPSGDVDWSDDESAFVAQWAPRIDAYLAGSPMAGQGEAFARAAWKYGVDPRWSPAISNTESSKGLHCFKPYNAWGWGTVSWSSWPEAIDAHVRGLARGYGYTISIEAAKKYCPPNWQHWYTVTLAEMNKI